VAGSFPTRATRRENSGEIEAALVMWCERIDAVEAMSKLEAAGIPCGRVNDIPSASKEASKMAL